MKSLEKDLQTKFLMEKLQYKKSAGTIPLPIIRVKNYHDGQCLIETFVAKSDLLHQFCWVFHCLVVLCISLSNILWDNNPIKRTCNPRLLVVCYKASWLSFQLCYFYDTIYFWYFVILGFKDLLTGLKTKWTEVLF